jgi:beta-glucanase (GH16 family)
VTSHRLIAAFALVAAACEANTDAATVTDAVERPPALNTAFVERFQTPLDPAVWVVADGWTNGDWMDTAFDSEQTQTGAEGLTITLERAGDPDAVGKPYVTGELQTRARYDRGYFEIDMQVPRGDGLVSGFFTYTGPPFGDPHDEIDIEILGKDTTEAMLTVFADGLEKNTYVPLGFDAAEGFHLYAFEWTPEHIRWYADGRLLHEETADDHPLPTTPQIYFLHLWNSSTLSDWLGRLDESAVPQTLRVACMAAAERYEGEPLCRDP